MIPVSQVDFPIYGKQAEFRNLRTWIRGFVGGRGSGKTKIGSLDRLLSARNGETHMVVSPTNGDIDLVTWPTFQETAKEIGSWLGGVRSPSYRAWIRTQDGGRAEFVFKSGERPDRLRGPSMASLWLDEASVMHEDVMLYGTPVLRHKGRMGPLLMTFTPRGRRHWSCTTFFDVVDEALIPRDDRALVHATTRDNPFAPAQYYDSMRSLYSSGLAAQELAGEFVDLEGLMFLREWFAGKYVDVAPLNALYARYWDKAGTVAQDNPSASYSAGVLMCRTPDGLVYVVNVVRGQWSYLQRDKVMSQVAADDKERYGNVLIYVEQEPGSGGKESAQQTVRRLAMYPVYIDIVSGQKVRKSAHERLPGEAKVVRAAPLAAQCEAGNVHIVRGGWNTEYIEELTAFPEYAFSDQVDASSGAYNRLAKATGITMEGIERLESPMTGDGKWGVQLVRPSRRRNRVGRM